MRRSPPKAPPAPSIPELREAAAAFAIDVCALAAIAGRYPLAGIERQVAYRASLRARDFLADHPVIDQDKTDGGTE